MFDKDFLNVVDRVSDIFIDFMEEKGFDVSYHNDKYLGNGATAFNSKDTFVPIFELSNQLYPKMFTIFIKDRNGNSILTGNYAAIYSFNANDMTNEEIFDTFIKMLDEIYNNYGIYNKNNRLDFTFKELKEDRKSYSKHQNNKKILEDLQNTITNYLDNCTDEEWKKILNDYCIEDIENYMGESRKKIEETIIECFKDMDKESIESEINRYSKYLDKIIEM